MTGTYRHTVEGGMQRSFASLVAVFAGVWLAQLVVNVSRLSEVVIASSAVFVVFLAVVFVRAWRIRLGVADTVLATVVAMVVSASFLAPAEYVPPIGARNNSAVVAGVLLASLLPGRIAWPACVGLIVAYLLLSLNIDGVVGSAEGLWPVVAAAAAAGAVSWVMRTAAGRADRSGDALLEAKAREAATAGRRAAHQAFQRTLHDDVSSALRAVNTAGLDAVSVRDACVAALRAASRAPEVVDPDRGTDLAAALVGLPAPCGPDFDLRCSRSVQVPADVVAAVVGAVGEALRNVERYADAERVVIELTGDEAAFMVRISDDGRGFRPEGVRLTSVGLRRSVIGLLEEVGGTATVRSEPGAGTTVELRWIRAGSDLDPPERDRIRGIRTAVGDIRPPLAAVCLPYLMGSAVLAARYSVYSAGMAWLAGWYAVVVLLTVLLLLRGNREVGAGLVMVAAAWSLTGLVLALRIIPADSLDGYASWPIGGLAPLLVVLATVRPPWESVAILVVEEIAIILMLLDGVLFGDDLATLLPPLLSPGLPLVMGLVITATTARLGRSCWARGRSAAGSPCSQPPGTAGSCCISSGSPRSAGTFCRSSARSLPERAGWTTRACGPEPGRSNGSLATSCTFLECSTVKLGTA
jgi:signal transduction histidine kinase